MANEEHVKILKQGVEAWNKWRKENPTLKPDFGADNYELHGANLNGRNLQGINLSDANLKSTILTAAHFGKRLTFVEGRTEFEAANLSNSDLSSAFLLEAEFHSTNLRNARLIKSHCYLTDFSGADLFGAVLIQAGLTGTIFSATDLTGADFTGAYLYQARFLSVNLTDAFGLDMCKHMSASSVDYQTLIKSKGLPDVFLRGCGLPDSLIDWYKLLHTKASEYYSCFISYSHDDKEFATHLFDALQNEGIRCWLDRHQILPGDDIRDQIDRGISRWDKVILCCSKSSLESYWVNTEIDKALRKEEQLWKERNQKTLAMIPLNLDGYLFDWQNSRASLLTDRHAENLVGWKKDRSKLQNSIARIKKALRADGEDRERPPNSLL
ncbi:MAG: toll/interleukin-1 receptor domain-containing protein [candidate division Zixibacteria bacterium]|nr:toll/interleukin-1 receptor domain-containing protein [candidate division Zixibacteria bacterium]MBU1471251.1 toll/interleukin-1 receptor domain-containing protein [candidate division Zixibacteria bacterium]MBU2624953.1 toll/interleukin-1 receptor domain-containing protein [candidate division Zixibacteria bacterium]